MSCSSKQATNELANHHAIIYCLQGTILMSVFDPIAQISYNTPFWFVPALPFQPAVLGCFIHICKPNTNLMDVL